MGIDADPSITRITFKQYREWVLQNASKADTRRLNLEYIDIIIDYILNALQQPWVSDDACDVGNFNIERDRVLKVGFNPSETVIPESPEMLVMSGSAEEEGDGVRSEGVRSEGVRSEGGMRQTNGENYPNSGHENERQGVATNTSAVGGASVGLAPPLNEGAISGKTISPSSLHSISLSSNQSSQRENQSIQNQQRDSQLRQGLTYQDMSSAGSSGGCTSTSSSVGISGGARGSSIGARGSSIGASSSSIGARGSSIAARGSSIAASSSSIGASSSSVDIRGSGVRGGHTKPHLRPPKPTNASTTHTPHSHTSSRVGRCLNTSGRVSSSSRHTSGGTSSAATAGRTSGEREGTREEKEGFARTRGELSRLLLENIPREILKRMVIRWPVGDEPTVVSRAELNHKRLMLTLWDVSGDPIQHNFIPFFFSNRCLFVCMYNLTRPLDDPCVSYLAKNLQDADGCVPTNAEALESWLGYVGAFSQALPSVPFRCTDSTPVLPPAIIACSFSDDKKVRENPVDFHSFFSRPSFESYRKHLVDSGKPGALVVSSYSENQGEEGYAGHHLLRREIDHVARQMPFCRDNVPIQWVKFEQLIYGLQEQKKIVVLYDDLTRFVSEHCNVTGTLQILPMLSHFHDIGVVSCFYRHPLLSNVVITKPQWLADALSSVIASSPSKWVTTEIQVAFARLSREGIATMEMLLLAYRCGRMHQRYWSETLFILNCMDLVCCHPSCHKSGSLYVPCLVTQPFPHSLNPSPNTQGTHIPSTSPPPSSSSSSSAAVLHFSSGEATFPIATYNQFVVCCVRNSRYAPKLFYCTAHIRLSPTHHLIISKHRTSLSLRVHPHHTQVCPPCTEVPSTSYPPSLECSHIQHIMGEEGEHLQSENIGALFEISTKLRPVGEPRLGFEEDTLEGVCPGVLEFASHHLNFLTSCWFPGLRLELIANLDGGRVVLDRRWRHDVLGGGAAPPSLRVWFR